MGSQVMQIKVTVPVPLGEFLKSKAAKYGLPIAAYIRHLILEDVVDMEIPTFQASEKIENSYKAAINVKQKAVPAGDVSKFLKDL